VFCFSRLS